MKLRWRRLTQTELEAGTNGAVQIARTSHYSDWCVLEWQNTEQTQKDFWTRVEIPSMVPARVIDSERDAEAKP